MDSVQWRTANVNQCPQGSVYSIAITVNRTSKPQPYFMFLSLATVWAFENHVLISIELGEFMQCDNEIEIN